MSDLLKIFAGGIAFLFLLNLCSPNKQTPPRISEPTIDQTVNVTVAGQEAADGLDLKAVTSLLKDVKTPEEFEKKLNGDDPRINNLDLNEDGTVDYLKVDEYEAEGKRGFSITTELGSNDIQEIATIEILREPGEKVSIQTQGNPQIYGNNHYYHGGGFGFTDFLLMSYLFSPHRSYASPYGYNRYPSSFDQRRKPMSSARYKSNVRNRLGKSGAFGNKFAAASAPAFKPTSASPNKAAVSNSIKAPLRKPTASQRKFQARNPSKTVRSGGFGQSRSGSSSKPRSSSGTSSKPKPRSSTPSWRSSGSSRSRSSFGGGK